jgi:hypothetical protein
MRMRLRWKTALAIAAGVAWTGIVQADDGGTAQALFDKGVADLESGKPETACPAFAESQRLDPRAGTLFALADCEAALGKIASALGHYHEYLGWVSRLPAEQQERHADRVGMARSQVEALQTNVPTLVINVWPSVPPGGVVERDGVGLQGAALGAALPIDPGDHVIVFRQPNAPEERVEVTLGKGDSKVIDLGKKPEPPAAVAPLAVVPPTTEPTSDREPSKGAPDGGPSSQRTWGYTATGVGIAGLLVGAMTGLMVLDKKGVVNSECRNEACSKEGMAAVDSARTLATVSTIAFGVGVIGVGTGVTLILTAPESKKGSGAWVGVTREF